VLPALVLAYALVVAAAPGPQAHGASSSVTVSLNVASVATLDASQCQAGSAGRTDFGTVLPGTTAVTPLDCQVAFGSTNDTSQLRVWQTDGLGTGMWLPAWGSIDTAVGGGDGFISETYSATGQDFYMDSSVQADGSLVAVGRQGSGAAHVIVARYLPSGARDTAGFGAPNGYVTLSANTTTDQGETVQLLSDGSMLVGAHTQNATPFWDFTIFKLDSTGAPVDGFGVGGTLVRSTAGGNDRVYGICADESRNRGYAIGDVAGNIGVFAFDLTTGADVAAFGPLRTLDVLSTDQARGCLVDGSGNVVVVGWSDNSGNGRMVVARYTPAGALDPTFDGPSTTGNGVVVLDLDTATNAAEVGWDAGLAADGDLLIVGGVDEGGLGKMHELVVRLDGATGDLDPTFGGGDGWRAVDITGSSPAFGTEIELLPDGRFYTVGGAPGAFDGWVRRYRADGSDDPSFGGGDGQFSWDWPISANTFADTRGLSLGVDGQVWVVGEDNDGDDEAVVTRLESLPVTDYGAGANWGNAAGFFGMCVRSVSGTAFAVTAPWTAAACTQAAGSNWGAVPINSATAGSKVAQLLTAGANDGVVQLRFGMRVPTSQRPGTYLAPITFEVIAPDGP
jgi:uncharacterized delta-60 repeat protein